jgi:HD-GYP domain-containing protein (c-di-GMP phosphodiesterase class II)/GAF domain-containing protein
MTTALVQRLAGVRDLKRILETTVKEIGDALGTECCQIMLSNPLDPNVTSICEYRLNQGEQERLPTVTFPLVLHGGSFGSVSLTKREPINIGEINAMRVMLGELGAVIRQAQINDVVQRDTFRESFLVEIGNVMALSFGIGDALFMVVNILGTALKASRCLFICTDDTQAGWKCYEFWQQDKVQSCHQYRWPTTDSAVIAQSLLSRTPLKFFEGQQNSYVSPVQEELQFIGVRSLLGIPLRSADAVHGCVILHQCDYRRAWTYGEIDMVQNVADKVAEALVKLPVEKRAREPIMQLHQRIVTPDQEEGKASIQSVRAALKGALGQQAIPSAAKTSAPSKPSVLAPPVAPTKPVAPPKPAASQANIAARTTTDHASAVPPTGEVSMTPGKAVQAMLDFGPSGAPQAESQPDVSADAAAAITGDAPPVVISEAPTEAPGEPTQDDFSPTEVETPTESETKAESAWGDLDSIPTPKAAQSATGPGLGRKMSHKAKNTQAGMQSALLASLHKDKAAFAAAKAEGAPPDAFVEGPPIEIDEEEAQAKLNRILASSSSTPTSDYIFATPGLDARMLARMDGWISEIEQKDKYVNGHARQVAEISTVIAKQMNLSEDELNMIRQAALLHDLGKLGSSPTILQKRDEELSDPELITVMRHPLDGAELLESFPDLARLAQVVRAHHEEFDGNGYPQGLGGEDIPLAARIVFIANAYFNLISPMRYGPGIAPDEALKLIVAGKDKQYDPNVVDAFVACFTEGKIQIIE